MAKGLNYLHLHNPVIIHRDLKTQNILVIRCFDTFNLNEVDSDDNIQIADFGTKFKSCLTFRGISRVLSNTMTGFTGTVAYMVLFYY